MIVNFKQYNTSITKTIIKLFISITALYFVYKVTDIDQIINVLSKIRIKYFILAFLAFNISKIISSVRLNRFYKSIGLLLSQQKNLKLYYVGMFYNLFLPGSIGGDGYKVFLLKDKPDIKIKQLICATLMDRISGVSILLSISIILLAFVLKRIDFMNGWLLFSTAVSCSILVIAVYYFSLKWFLPYFISDFSYTTWLSYLVQLGQVLAAYFLLVSIGLTVSSFDYLLLFMLSSLAAVLPVTIGGVGVREFVFLYGYKYLLIDKNMAIAFTSLFFAVLALSAIIGFFFSFNIDQ